MPCPSSVCSSFIRPLLFFHIFDISSETTERNSSKLDRRQDLNVLYQVCIFRADQKNKMAALAEIFSTSPLKPLKGIQWNLTGAAVAEWLSSWLAEQEDRGSIPGLAIWIEIWLKDCYIDVNLQNNQPTKLDRKQDLNVLYQVCVFRADWKNKMAALASDWLRHFRLLLWNRHTEFKETWKEARSQHPPPSLCFSGQSERQYSHPSLSLAETFSMFSLKSLNRIQRKLSGSKISKSPTKFVFFRPITI